MGAVLQRMRMMRAVPRLVPLAPASHPDLRPHVAETESQSTEQGADATAAVHGALTLPSPAAPGEARVMSPPSEPPSPALVGEARVMSPSSEPPSPALVGEGRVRVPGQGHAPRSVFVPGGAQPGIASPTAEGGIHVERPALGAEHLPARTTASTGVADKRERPRTRGRGRVLSSLFILHSSLFIAAVAAAAWFLWNKVAAFDPFVAWSTVRAELMLFAASPGFGRLGYALPPLSTLLQVPLVIIPAIRAAHLSATIISATSGVAAALGTFSGLRALGLGRPTSTLLALLFVAQPLFLLDAGSGSSAPLAAALTVWTAALLIRWEATGNVIPLVVSSFTLAAACLADYSVLLIIPMILVFLGALVGFPRVEADAFMIAYVTPAAAATLPWFLANLVYTGHLLTFHPAIVSLWSAGNLAQPVSPSFAAHLKGDLALATPALVLGTLLTAVVAVRTRRQRETFLTLLGAALLLPGVFDFVGWPLQPQFDPLAGAALGVLLAGWAITSMRASPVAMGEDQGEGILPSASAQRRGNRGALTLPSPAAAGEARLLEASSAPHPALSTQHPALSTRQLGTPHSAPGTRRHSAPGAQHSALSTRHSASRWLATGAAILMLLAGIGSQLWGLENGFGPSLSRPFVRALLGSQGSSQPVPAKQAAAFLAAHATVREAPGRGKDPALGTVLADDRYDFPIIFFSPNPAVFLTPDDRPAFDLAVSAPRKRLEYVIVSRAARRSDDRVEARYPGLYARGAGWAELAGEWPAGNSPAWRLYHVRPAL